MDLIVIGLNPQLIFVYLNSSDLVEIQCKDGLAINGLGPNALHLVFIVNQSICRQQCPPDLDGGPLRLPWTTRLGSILLSNWCFLCPVAAELFNDPFVEDCNEWFRLDFKDYCPLIFKISP